MTNELYVHSVTDGLSQGKALFRRATVLHDKYGNDIDASNPIATGKAGGVNNVSATVANITYVGREDLGQWIVQKIDTSVGATITWATVKNNPAVTAYADAWSASTTTLSYGLYTEAF